MRLAFPFVSLAVAFVASAGLTASCGGLNDRGIGAVVNDEPADSGSSSATDAGTPPTTVTCGAGTHLSGSQCVLDTGASPAATSQAYCLDRNGNGRGDCAVCLDATVAPAGYVLKSAGCDTSDAPVADAGTPPTTSPTCGAGTHLNSNNQCVPDTGTPVNGSTDVPDAGMTTPDAGSATTTAADAGTFVPDAGTPSTPDAGSSSSTSTYTFTYQPLSGYVVVGWGLEFEGPTGSWNGWDKWTEGVALASVAYTEPQADPAKTRIRMSFSMATTAGATPSRWSCEGGTQVGTFPTPPKLGSKTCKIEVWTVPGGNGCSLVANCD